jgi:protein gp37
MADRTLIEWADATWTPVKGCTRVSPGCGGPGREGGCYAEIMAARFSNPGQWGEDLAKIVTLPDGTKDHRWTGVIRFDEAELLKPLRWKAPRKVFVCSTADLFHDGVTDEQIDRVFAVMALSPQHTFQVLTKRSARMRRYITDRARMDWLNAEIEHVGLKASVPTNCVCRCDRDDGDIRWPLPNVWLGISTEDQTRAEERIPDLLATRAAVRWISAEPLLGPIDLTQSLYTGEGGVAMRGYLRNPAEPDDFHFFANKLDWVVAGGESGPGARPMHPDWARSLRDQCAAAGVPFLFKQWGAYLPAGQVAAQTGPWDPRCGSSLLTTKKNAGRLLDGVQHDGYPARVAA